MHMCVCVREHAYVCVHARVCRCVHACVCMHVCACMCVCMWTVATGLGPRLGFIGFKVKGSEYSV